jgi:orotate phosphoribosyltransferase
MSIMADRVAYWNDTFRRVGAVWKHGGKERSPHARIGGLLGEWHSNALIDVETIHSYPALVECLAEDLLDKLETMGVDFSSINRVVGISNRSLADGVARGIGEDEEHFKGRRQCRTSVATKVPREIGLGCFITVSIEEGDTVLLCDDVVTTGHSLDFARESIKAGGGRVLPFVLTLANASGLKEVCGFKIVSMFELSIEKWSPAECPLCKSGSRAMSVCLPGVWQKLVAATRESQ